MVEANIANETRRAAAAQRTVELAAAALADPGLELSEQERQVLQVRVDHPDASLRQLGQRTQLTKDQYARRLVRTLRRAERDRCVAVPTGTAGVAARARVSGPVSPATAAALGEVVAAAVRGAEAEGLV